MVQATGGGLFPTLTPQMGPRLGAGQDQLAERQRFRSRTRVEKAVTEVRSTTSQAASVTTVITTVRISSGTWVGPPAASRYPSAKPRTPSIIGWAPPPPSRRSAVPG